MILLSAVTVLLLAGQTLAQTNCGEGVGNCGKENPCCNEKGKCGRSALDCGGGCQSAFSFKPNLPDGSCYGDRRNGGRRCVSGKYLFDKETWVQNADAFNGDVDSTDFVVDNPSNIFFSTRGGTTVQVSAPNPILRQNPGIGVKLSTSSYMLYGRFSAIIKASNQGGVITSFIGLSDSKDGINFDFAGKDPTKVFLNSYVKGGLDYGRGIEIDAYANSTALVHEYSVDWSETQIVWAVDGRPVRTLTAAQAGAQFPTSPMRIQIGVVDGGYSNEALRNWAGGYINWAKDKVFQSVFYQVTIQCKGDPIPSGPPPRNASYSTPTLKDSKIDIAVPGLEGYVDSGKEGIPGASSVSANDVIRIKVAIGTILSSLLLSFLAL